MRLPTFDEWYRNWPKQESPTPVELIAQAYGDYCTKEALRAAPERKLYGYGVVDKDGNPWWNESCVCEDSAPMQEVVENLNDVEFDEDARAPYRVVKLYWGIPDV